MPPPTGRELSSVLNWLIPSGHGLRGNQSNRMHKTPARRRTRCKFFHTDHGGTFLQEPHKCFTILGLEAVIFADSAARLGSILALWLSMTTNDADRDRIRELCSLIAVQQDRQKLLQLIEELSLILGAKDDHLKVKQLGH